MIVIIVDFDNIMFSYEFTHVNAYILINLVINACTMHSMQPFLFVKG